MWAVTCVQSQKWLPTPPYTPSSIRVSLTSFVTPEVRSRHSVGLETRTQMSLLLHVCDLLSILGALDWVNKMQWPGLGEYYSAPKGDVT